MFSGCKKVKRWLRQNHAPSLSPPPKRKKTNNTCKFQNYSMVSESVQIILFH